MVTTGKKNSKKITRRKIGNLSALILAAIMTAGCAAGGQASQTEPVKEELESEAVPSADQNTQETSAESEIETATETNTDTEAETSAWEAIPQEELDAAEQEKKDAEALQKMEEDLAAVGDVGELSEEEMQELLGNATAVVENAQSTGSDQAIELEYQFSGKGGTEEIDWAALEEQYPAINFVLSIPDLNIHIPVLLDTEADAAGAEAAFVEGDINSEGFVPKLVVYSDVAEESSPLKNVRVFADEAFFKDHPYLYIYTKDYTYEYRVFAAYNQFEETDIHNYDFGNQDSFWEYLRLVFNQRGMGVNIDPELEMTVMLEHQIFEILLPNSDGSLFAVQAVINGKIAR